MIEADIKFAKEHTKVELSDISNLPEKTNGKEIQTFHIVMIRSFGANFASNKKFILLIEQMVLEYYQTYVQHVSTWTRPTPKLVQEYNNEEALSEL